MGYGESDLMVPLLDDLPDAASPGGLAAANLAAIAWCTQVNAAVHSQIVAVPAERLVAEAPLLRALPSLRAGIGPAPVVRKVNKLSCVRFPSARYSVPTALIGTHVHLVPHGGRLQVVIPATGLIFADHEIVAPGGSSVLDAHYGGPRPAPTRKVRPRSAAEQELCALGEVAAAFITGAAASGNTRLSGELVELNAQAAAHGQAMFGRPGPDRGVSAPASGRRAVHLGRGRRHPRPHRHRRRVGHRPTRGRGAVAGPVRPDRDDGDLVSAPASPANPEEATRSTPRTTARGEDFYSATSGDLLLAIDTSYVVPKRLPIPHYRDRIGPICPR